MGLYLSRLAPRLTVLLFADRGAELSHWDMRLTVCQYDRMDELSLLISLHSTLQVLSRFSAAVSTGFECTIVRFDQRLKLSRSSRGRFVLSTMKDNLSWISTETDLCPQ